MKHVLRAFLAVCLLFGGVGQSFACGNPLLWALLFEHHPEAKVAFQADLDGRKAGIVQARPFLGRPGVSYHSWSIKSLNKLAQEMAPSISANLREGETFTVLLAIEVAAIRFRGGDSAPEIISAAQIKTISEYDVTTTVNVLHSGWRNSLAYDAMVENDLLILATPEAGETIASLFGTMSNASLRP
ncbi:hypothetical protein [Ruegeria arenilitoris]|uniref:hypothetical protein n=1 Tax=Ruegeria arenilitoris TaxID=1173585 RepID=UPI00147D23E4|nr:hypothetical protein [Ruegeria arenilitoris]